MRELPPAVVPNAHEESRTIAYITDSSVVVHNPQRWTTATSLQNQVHSCSLVVLPISNYCIPQLSLLLKMDLFFSVSVFSLSLSL